MFKWKWFSRPGLRPCSTLDCDMLEEKACTQEQNLDDYSAFTYISIYLLNIICGTVTVTNLTMRRS